jgi:hypothetical protein
VDEFVPVALGRLDGIVLLGNGSLTKEMSPSESWMRPLLRPQFATMKLAALEDERVSLGKVSVVDSFNAYLAAISAAEDGPLETQFVARRSNQMGNILPMTH